MTSRVVLVLLAGGLVATACTHDAAPDNADRGATETTESDPTCRRELAELDRRDEADSIDWEAVERPEEEPTEPELETVTIERDPFPAEVVAADGERPTFPDFPDRLDISMLSDVELVEAVDTCYEIGLLADEDDAEAGDDEAG